MAAASELREVQWGVRAANPFQCEPSAVDDASGRPGDCGDGDGISAMRPATGPMAELPDDPVWFQNLIAAGSDVPTADDLPLSRCDRFIWARVEAVRRAW